MKLLGSRLRYRRRQLHLHQREVVGTSSASFLSKVENGVAQPSLSNLRDWSQVLETTSGDLIGDHLLLEAAKHSVLVPEKCHGYLDHLPVNPLTTFLRELTSSATSLSIPVPNPPQDPELQYLTALVLLKRGTVLEASQMSKSALDRCSSPLWRIYHLSLLCLIYAELSEPLKKRETEEDLHSTLEGLNYKELLQALPESAVLSSGDLDLLKFSALLNSNPLS